MSIKTSSQIYINGWSEWARVIDEKNGDVKLGFYDRAPEWHSKSKIQKLMLQDESLPCEE